MKMRISGSFLQISTEKYRKNSVLDISSGLARLFWKIFDRLLFKNAVVTYIKNAQLWYRKKVVVEISESAEKST